MICPGCKTDNMAGKMLCYKCGANLLQALEGGPPQERKKKGGCMKGCLIGCLVVIMLSISASIALWINRDRIAEWVERAALSVVSEEVNKEEVRKVIAEVREALERGDLDPVKLENVMGELTEYMADGKLDKEEVDRLMESFREAIKVEEEKVPPSP